MRVLKWMLDRIDGTAQGTENVFGISPRYEDLNWNGLDFTRASSSTRVIGIDKAAWQQELTMHDELFTTLAYHLPDAAEDDQGAHRGGAGLTALRARVPDDGRPRAAFFIPACGRLLSSRPRCACRSCPTSTSKPRPSTPSPRPAPSC